jgi:branched-subunit amino acid ABC-type transport system permease component
MEWSVPPLSLFAADDDLARFRAERGLIKHLQTPHADQTFVTFRLALVLQEIIKYFFGVKPDSDLPMPPALPAV